MSIFNEFGVPNKEIEDFARDLETSSNDFIVDLVKKGCSATEIRAVGSYLSSCINISVSLGVLNIADKIRKDRIANADKNLSQDEINSIKNGNNIEAFKSYRHRTGLGLKESKEAVETLYRENHETY